jgi:polar amino acid transport system substrate-binding protein
MDRVAGDQRFTGLEDTMASVDIRGCAHLAPRDTLGEILERGTLRVPVQWQSPPQLSGEPPEFYMDPETGQPAGIVITLSTLMAGDLRVRPEFVNIPWKDQIDALRRREVDVLLKHCNTPARALAVDFGARLMAFRTVVTVRKDDPFRNPEDLNRDGVVIATTEASSCARAIERHFPNAAIAESSFTGARDALTRGTIQAFVTDAVTKSALAVYPDHRVLRDEHGQVVVLAHEYAHAAVYPGDQRFLNWVNNWISYWRAQGVLDYWCDTWWLSWFVA